MTKTLTAATMAIFLMGTASSLMAHHAFSAEFDAARPVHLTGSITKVEWVNRHAMDLHRCETAGRHHK